MSAPLYVIAPLPLAPADARRIDAIRQAHDPQAGLVPPHFTLVFGARGATAGQARAHVAAVAAATAPIAWRLERVLAADDYLFLMPGEGDDALRRLHRALYAGPFAADLRADIAFAPHVTVGVLPTPAEAAALAEILSRQPIGIAGRLDHLQLAAFDGHRLDTLGVYPLSGPAPAD
ncbi:2'-5' RNA ligase family protein [Caulobacter sp. KR2-114]|uniref:2'-5' RNA ligase family protein n=1 Tax=Caulobacter sp. KR2-114 TaxID=3400912 RepID=UPI003C0F88B6